MKSRRPWNPKNLGGETPQQRSEAAFRRLAERAMRDETPLELHIPIKELWLLISGLQLATKHPRMTERQREVLTALGRQFQSAITERYPETESLIEDGWDQRRKR